MKEASFIPWLLTKRAEGYALVGLEQTDRSVKLPDFQYSAATVLVIGREREGIPENVLQVRHEIQGMELRMSARYRNVCSHCDHKELYHVLIRHVPQEMCTICIMDTLESRGLENKVLD